MTIVHGCIICRASKLNAEVSGTCKNIFTVMFVSFRTDRSGANSAHPDQTASRGAVWSGSSRFAIPSASFGCISLR